MLDTNVLASGAISASGSPGAILDAWNRHELLVILSAWILQELARTLQNPYFSERLSLRDTADFLEFVQDRAVLVHVDEQDVARVASHREDDFIVATAVAGQVDYLVTGDRMVRQLEEHESIRILTPREFLVVLEAQQPG